MSRLAIAIGAAAFASVAFGSAAFALQSGPFSETSVAMIVFGLIAIALVGLAGLILVRAPWSRWILGGAVTTATLLASIGGGARLWILLLVSSVAIIGIAGPWLTLWVRQEPAAESLGPVPVILMASGAAAPILVGLASHGGVGLLHWLFVIILAVSAWAYGRGIVLGVWGLRLAVPASGVVAAAQTDAPSSALIAAGALGIMALAWTAMATRVTAVITPPLPSPVSRKAAGNAGQ